MIWFGKAMEEFPPKEISEINEQTRKAAQKENFLITKNPPLLRTLVNIENLLATRSVLKFS